MCGGSPLLKIVDVDFEANDVRFYMLRQVALLVGWMTSLHAECVEFALLGLGEVPRVVGSPIPGQSLRGRFASSPA